MKENETNASKKTVVVKRKILGRSNLQQNVIPISRQFKKTCQNYEALLQSIKLKYNPEKYAKNAATVLTSKENTISSAKNIKRPKNNPHESVVHQHHKTVSLSTNSIKKTVECGNTLKSVGQQNHSHSRNSIASELIEKATTENNELFPGTSNESNANQNSPRQHQSLSHDIIDSDSESDVFSGELNQLNESMAIDPPIDECKNEPDNLLFQKYFQIIEGTQDKNGNIAVKCLICMNEPEARIELLKPIRGALHATSNFIRHLRVFFF